MRKVLDDTNTNKSSTNFNRLIKSVSSILLRVVDRLTFFLNIQHMRKIYSLMIVSFILFIVGCNILEEKKTKHHISEIETKILRDSKVGEDFNSFFQFFKTDTAFQFERTAFPFVYRCELVTINAAGDMIDTIIKSSDKTDWRFASWVARNPQKIEIKKDSAFMIFIDSVYVREYIDKQIFIKQNDRWYLKDEDIIVLNPGL